jgi:hypothetical protein
MPASSGSVRPPLFNPNGTGAHLLGLQKLNGGSSEKGRKKIKELKKQRADAKAELARSLIKHLDEEPLNPYAMESKKAEWGGARRGAEKKR